MIKRSQQHHPGDAKRGWRIGPFGQLMVQAIEQFTVTAASVMDHTARPDIEPALKPLEAGTAVTRHQKRPLNILKELDFSYVLILVVRAIGGELDPVILECRGCKSCQFRKYGTVGVCDCAAAQVRTGPWII